ncbi:hypothetical protein [Candidatus Nucleicultrix amoebiphila]|uniref:Uncharacterized protein n=1 Tax=Candidatus Nucleicultrix amoebiphila FS5 TaxID=1414854 RepID=A0A1W6N4I5_9PROT|nr:hypothetical protein [Candidatus Nucleicultrix amoebiphila]ARN84780.1 hypothetical protein GQ61_05160 [Candidatus Nucleicultrix amoebiphila FS5]
MRKTYKNLSEIENLSASERDHLSLLSRELNSLYEKRQKRQKRKAYLWLGTLPLLLVIFDYINKTGFISETTFLFGAFGLSIFFISGIVCPIILTRDYFDEKRESKKWWTLHQEVQSQGYIYFEDSKEWWIKDN